MTINIYLSVITLNVNSLNALNKRHRVIRWIEKQEKDTWGTSEAYTSPLCYKWIPWKTATRLTLAPTFKKQDTSLTVRETGGKVLVHCEAGISCPPTICMVYFMKTRQFCLKDAFDYIKQTKKKNVSPNFVFMGQFLQYESEILPSTPTLQALSCQGEAASFSFTAHLQTLSP